MWIMYIMYMYVNVCVYEYVYVCICIVPSTPPVVWVVVGGGRSCICMYMNVHVWYECIFPVFVNDYDLICI